MTELTDSDRALWIALHEEIIKTGQVPKMADFGKQSGLDDAKFAAALDRLGENHYVALHEVEQPNDERELRELRELLMLHPFSPVPTAHRVVCGETSYWANCFWDALGIPPMLGRDGRVESSCGCCGASATFEIRDGELGKFPGGEGVVHFAVPAKDWWKDVEFT